MPYELDHLSYNVSHNSKWMDTHHMGTTYSDDHIGEKLIVPVDFVTMLS